MSTDIGSKNQKYMIVDMASVCVCVCVRACVRACGVYMRVYFEDPPTFTDSTIYTLVAYDPRHNCVLILVIANRFA